MSGYRIRLYEPPDREAVCELQTYLWSGDPELNGRVLEWKYERNPYMNAPLIVLAKSERGETVGCRGMFGSEWHVPGEGETVVVPCAGDVVVHPDHRNRGLFAQMTTFAQDVCRAEGYPFALNLSANWLSGLGYQALGWRSIESPEPIRRYGAELRARLRRVARRAPGVLELWRKTRPTPTDTGAAESRMVDPFARMDAADTPSGVRVETATETDALAANWQTVRSDQIRHTRTPEFLSWRLNNPLAAYRVLTVDGVPGSVIVQSDRLVGRRAAFIVECTVQDADALSRLAAFATTGFDHVTVWRTTMPAAVRTTLERLRFEPVGESSGVTASRPAFYVKPLALSGWDLNGLDLRDKANWDIRMLDSDNH